MGFWWFVCNSSLMEVSILKLLKTLMVATALSMPFSLVQAAELQIGFVSIAGILKSAPPAVAAS